MPSTHNQSRTSGCSTPRPTSFFTPTIPLEFLCFLTCRGRVYRRFRMPVKGKRAHNNPSSQRCSTLFHSWAHNTYLHTKHTTTFMILEGGNYGARSVCSDSMHLYWRLSRKGGHTIFLLLECNVFPPLGWESTTRRHHPHFRSCEDAASFSCRRLLVCSIKPSHFTQPYPKQWVVL